MADTAGQVSFSKEQRVLTEALRVPGEPVLPLSALWRTAKNAMSTALSDPPWERAVSSVSRGVLIVDDEPMILNLLERCCTLSDLQPYLAASGEEAVEVYRRQGDRIGVVLLDVRMPGMSGPATLDALRRLNPDVRCCFMSGDPGDFTAEELLGRGALHLFNKPLPLRELIAALQNAVAGSTHAN